MIQLIPQPSVVKLGKHSYALTSLKYILFPEAYSNSLLVAAVDLADELMTLTRERVRFAHIPADEPGVELNYVDDIEEGEDYRIIANAEGIVIEAGTETGLFYGLQTLRQIVLTCGGAYPELTISDTPQFANRGFYHDVTRGKVPTLETLYKLVDKLAFYKINQLQLYVEHTFCFANHSDIWAGSDPLTAEEIIKLDRYCIERQIDLVPSLATFGHLYMAIRSKRNEHLNELDVKGSELPYSLVDRMLHYTLDCSNNESLELVESMLNEFLPLFSSCYFNICCDETFDLGKGRNKSRCNKDGGSHLMYIEFLKKIIEVVNRYGRTAMFWGDIIAEKPELISELAEGTIALEWDYDAPATRHDTEKLSEVADEFYVCPGVSGWNQFLNNINVASDNIVNYARKGLKYGAAGLLNTDWGDLGHVNLLGCSYHGMILGAAAGWNLTGAEKLPEFDAAFETLELGGCKGFVALWRRLSQAQAVNWSAVEQWIDPSESVDNVNWTRKDPELLEKSISEITAIYQEMLICSAGYKSQDELVFEELLIGARGALLCQKISLAINDSKRIDCRKVADEIRFFDRDFSKIWLKRNQASEYYRVREVLLIVAEKLDELAR